MTPAGSRRNCSARIFDRCGSSAEIVGDTSFISSDEFFLGEPGKHVVQRYDRKGRRHTSVVTVAVLPLLEHSSAGALRSCDVTVSTQRGHGPGGQHQNKTDSAVRMRHLPTGIEVFINGRDQHKNRRTARRILESRVAEAAATEAADNRKKAKRRQVGDGGRSGKRRTYNFIDSRVTDHVTGAKTGRIRDIMRGKFDVLAG